MPNWAHNALSLKGKKDYLDKVLSEIGSFNEAGESVPFDFNTLIPMPKDLEIVAGSMENDCLYAYGLIRPELMPQIKKIALTYHGKCDHEANTRAIDLRIACENAHWDAEKMRAVDDFTTWKEEYNLPDMLGKPTKEPDFRVYAAIGERYFQNIEKYGARHWHEWRCNNWGTKWNACDTNVIRKSETEAILIFDTAWTVPFCVLEKLSEKYPGLIIEGQLTGEVSRACKYHVKDGELIVDESWNPWKEIYGEEDGSSDD